MTPRKLCGLVIGSGLTAVATLAVACDAPLVPDGQEEARSPDLNASAGVTVETADVFGQGMMGPVVAEDGATIRRTPHGISMKLSMPTPEPGTYTYPSGPEGGAWTDEEGPPEVFTLWAFIFNNPEECATPFQCDSGDLGAPANGGAFFVAGHVFGGPNLTLSGHISRNSEPFPTATPGSPLENPKGAHVHLAVAPHGALDPALLPEQIQTPTGPGPDIWWLALFDQ